MDNFLISKINRKVINDDLDWICKFKIEDYIDNAPLIKKLYEEKQSAIVLKHKYENDIIDLKEVNHQLELKNKKLEMELHSIKSQKFLWYYILSLIPPLLIGIGVNLITSEGLSNQIGYGLIFIGVAIKIIEFFLPPRKI